MWLCCRVTVLSRLGDCCVISSGLRAALRSALHLTLLLPLSPCWGCAGSPGGEGHSQIREHTRWRNNTLIHGAGPTWGGQAVLSYIKKHLVRLDEPAALSERRAERVPGARDPTPRWRERDKLQPPIPACPWQEQHQLVSLPPSCSRDFSESKL